MNYEVDFDTFKELVNKIFTKNKLDKEKKSTIEVDDSDQIPFKTEEDKKEEKKQVETQKINQEAIPTED